MGLGHFPAEERLCYPIGISRGPQLKANLPQGGLIILANQVHDHALGLGNQEAS
jgi:hypothetical protein